MLLECCGGSCSPICVKRDRCHFVLRIVQRWRYAVHAGERIRQRRLELGVKPSQIERTSNSFARRFQEPRCSITHSTLSGIEAGALPSLYKILSLAYCLRLTDDQILDWYDVDLKTLRPVLQHRAAVQPIQLQHQDHVDLRNKHFPFPWPKAPPQPKTELFTASLPEHHSWQQHRFRFVRIGSKDNSMLDLLPPGSLVRVDTKQRKVLVFQWENLWHRPIYLIWHPFGHSCRWCQQNGTDLILISHPGSHHPVSVFRTPHEANVLGRVVSVWASHQEPSVAFPGTE